LSVCYKVDIGCLLKTLHRAVCNVQQPYTAMLYLTTRARASERESEKVRERERESEQARERARESESKRERDGKREERKRRE